MPMFPNGLNRLRDFLRAARFSASASVSLNALTVSNGSGTVGQALSSTINGLTSGSSVALTGAGAAGLSISGAVINGTPTTAGAVNIVETLAGATNSPNPTNGVITVAASGANYASRVANTEPTTSTLANPISEPFASAGASNVALAGRTLAGGTWTNVAIGTNPGTHSVASDGSGVVGNAAGRATSFLSGVTKGDFEMSADVSVAVTASEGKAGILFRMDGTNTSGTFYELEFDFANTIALNRYNAGTFTGLGTVGVAGVVNTYYNIRVRIVDIGDGTSAIRCWFNGVEVISVIDTAPLPAGSIGLHGGRNMHIKNLAFGDWQLQAATLLTPNAYDGAGTGQVVSLITATTAGATYTLADNDGGRFSLVDTGRKVNGRAQYNLVTTSTAVSISGGNTRTPVLRETKTGYTTKDTPSAIGVVAPLAAKPVRYITANGGEHNSQAGGGGQDAWHTYALMPLGAVGDDARLVFRSVAIGGDGTEYVPPSAASITKAALMIEGGKFRVPVTFGGARGATIPVTATGILESDPVTPAMFGLVEWPRGGQLRAVAQGRMTGPVPCGEVSDTGDTNNTYNLVYASANEVDWVDNASIPPPNYSGKASVAAAIFLTDIVGRTASDAVIAEGDSILYGFSETFNVRPTGAGWFGLMSTIGGIIPGHRSARAGILGQAYVSNGAGRRAMIQKGYATIGLDCFGTNDLNTAGTGDPNAINSMHTSVTADFKAAGMKVLRMQLLPRAVDLDIPLSSITVNGTTATATIADTTSAATLKVGQKVQLKGNSPAALNTVNAQNQPIASATILAINGNSFDYAVPSGTASATTVGVFSTAWGNQLQSIPAGWQGNGTSNRDVINAKNVSDVQSGAIDGVMDFLSAVSQSGNTGLWKYDGSTPYLTSGDGTHPQTPGHTAMAAVARNAILALAPGLA